MAEAGPITDELVGTTIDGRYLVSRLIGRGGMGKVYEADHVGLGKRVAIKFVSDADADRDQRARFRQEARAASRITHENVIQIFDVGADGRRDYLVMEYVEGHDLDAVLRDGVLPPARAIAIAQQMLRGLHACHAAGIVHRDIKPSNIRLTNDQDFVKIMDFGISKSLRANVAQTDTGAGRVIGTPEFMAPEQIVDGEVDHRADLFAVGATLYAMLAGTPPFSGTSFTQRVETRAAPPPSIAELRAGLPASLVDAITRALDPDPANRFADAIAFANALGDGAGIAAARSEAPTRKSAPPKRESRTAFAPTQAAEVVPTPRRRPWLLVAGLVVVAAAAVIAAIVTRAPAPIIVVATPDAGPVVDAIALAPVDAPAVDAVAIAPADASAPPDAAIPRAPSRPPAKVTDLPAGTVIAVEPKGKPCDCEFIVKGLTDRACTTLRKEPRCECKAGSTTSLCPFPIFVVDRGVHMPDGSTSGTMFCVDRTREECDPSVKDMPASCSAGARVATHGAACSGYRSGMTASDPKLDGTYTCSLCDPKPTNPKFYGKTGDQCVGYSRYTGQKVTGALRCYGP